MDINIMGITGVAGITVICYLLALCIKQPPLANKWLPTLCGLMGGLPERSRGPVGGPLEQLCGLTAV